MADYNIWCVKLGGVSVSEPDVGTALQGFFNRVIAGGSAKLKKRFSRAVVSWSTTCPNPQPWELLVYFVLPSDSVVSTLGGGPPGPGGFTAWSGGVTGSEVFVSGQSTSALLARLAFHEALHNKLHWSDARLHGAAGGGGLASASVSAATPLSNTNVSLMAGVLGTDRPQWTGGCTAYNDPLRGI